MSRETPGNFVHRLPSWQKKAIAVLVVLTVSIGFASVGWASASGSLKIIVYGATGRVGTRVVREALARGHQVTAVSRDLARITQQHENLVSVQGDLLDSASVFELIAGHDVIVVSVRGRVNKTRDPARTIQRMAAEVVIEAQRDMGDRAPRLIYVGGAGSLEVSPGVLYADSMPKLFQIMMPRGLRQEIRGHILTLEYLRTVNDVVWTYISPAKKFMPGERTGIYRIGGDKMLKDSKGKSMITMEDFSVALVNEIENPEHLGTRFSVAY